MENSLSNRRKAKMEIGSCLASGWAVSQLLKLVSSSKKHIPLVVQWGGEYYPWQLYRLLFKWFKFNIRLMRAALLGIRFSNARAVIREEWDDWKICYKPRLVTPNAGVMVLDAGSGEGETLFFYYLLGFRRFRCVEPDTEAFALLQRNVDKLPDVECELLNRTFRTSDLRGIDFAKIDVEGGEIELLQLPTRLLPIEIVMETHDRAQRIRLQVHLPDMMFQKQYIVTPERIVWRWLRKT